MTTFKPFLRTYWTIAALIFLFALLCWAINFVIDRFAGIGLRLASVAICLIIVALLILVKGLSVLKVATLLIKLRVSLPHHAKREVTIPNLNKRVKVTFDEYGIPTITGQSRCDTMMACGYISARDRFFQMDLLRRESAGRLSEVLGLATIESDVQKRVVGFNRIVKKIVTTLPAEQKEVLEAYSDGVNAYISQIKRRPFEFLALHYKPEPWGVEDCMLVVLTMFHRLCGDDSQKRMLTIMEESLPSQVVEFFTPDTDRYTSVLGWGDDSHNRFRT